MRRWTAGLALAWSWVGTARLDLLWRQAPYAQTSVSDSDYTMLAVMARN